LKDRTVNLLLKAYEASQLKVMMIVLLAPLLSDMENFICQINHCKSPFIKDELINTISNKVHFV